MKFGVREICDVVLRAKNRMQVGNKIFYKNEPVIYFDTLKTSSLEGAATQVYAQGGRGNPRLVAWEGERTVTFTMEDALISPEGFMILSGAGLIDATEGKPIYQHVTETVDVMDVKLEGDGNDASCTIPLSQKPFLPNDREDAFDGNFAYVMFMRDGVIISEPYIPSHYPSEDQTEIEVDEETGKFLLVVKQHDCYDEIHENGNQYIVGQMRDIKFDSVLVDYYVERKAGAQQIEITPDKFGGNFYLEADTLFRDQAGVDMPAEFIIPNCKIQSNFTFTMASSGDPSSFTFTMDAFPDYTRFDHSKKVLAVIQVIEEESLAETHRGATPNGTYSVDRYSAEETAHEDLLSDRINNAP